MEMISIYALVALLAIAVSVIFVKRLLPRWIRLSKGGFVPTKGIKSAAATGRNMTDLSDPVVLGMWNGLLKKYDFTGNADIRNGVMMPQVHPDRLDPLVRALINGTSILRKLRNPAACSLYVRDSVNDKFMLVPDIDIEVLVDAARVMQHVAENRRKSRHLYRGMTDDEIRSFVRAGMAAYFKDDGEFGWANEVGAGLWDDRPEFIMARYVVELIGNVKGAGN